MNKNNLTHGKRIFKNVEKLAKKEASFRIYAEEKASDLLLVSPFVVDTLRQNGILRKGDHHSKFISLFKYNLQSQRYGSMEGKSELLTVKYAGDRAKVVTEYIFKYNETIVEYLNKIGVDKFKFYYAIRDIFLKDTLQTDYIAGTVLSEEAETTAGIAVNRRMAESSGTYKEILVASDINPDDNTELRDVVRQTKFRDIVLDHYKDDPFYGRRNEAIKAKRKSIADDFDIADLDYESIPLFENRGNASRDKEFQVKVFARLIGDLGLPKEKIIQALEY